MPSWTIGRLAILCGLVIVFAVTYIAIQGVAGFGGWVQIGATPERVAAALDEIYREAPYLSRLEQDSPEMRDQLVDIVARDLDLGLTPAQILADAVKLFEEWQAEAMADAPDRVLIAYHELAVARLRELKDSYPDLCAAMTLGRDTPDTGPLLSPQLNQRQMYVNRMLLRAAPDETVSRMTSAETQAIAREIYANLRAAVGSDAALLYADRETTPQEDAIICRLGIATMESIANLGPERAPAVIRGLFFSS